jgi:aminopeptidase N
MMMTICGWAVAAVCLTSLALLGACRSAQAAALMVTHDLAVELVPAAHMLMGHDRMSIRVDDRYKLLFSLSERVTQIRVEVEGQPRTFKFSNSELELPLATDERRRTIEVVIAYEAVFNDPVPVNPLNTDNPGFGVTASITEAGAFLLSGAGWYPDLVDGQDSFALKVKAPAGILAVTAGLGLGHVTQDGKTVSEWRIDHPARGLALSAAAYRVRELNIGDVVAATYFLPQNQDLAPSYLEATARYLQLYSDLFGPYPFPKFAVVENFFPTGFGFPSYTLLGSTVLRLPFILDTSLGHEIAHCWWGNGVYVDFEGGNWSEALTTYVSDYLFKEIQSPDEAGSYRLQALRNYATLVPPGKDFPLSRFMNRTDTVTKAVGYDKGAMVFHMLRRRLGEDAFWGALRDIYREKLFQPASWDDLRAAFERRAGQPLVDFFDQWVKRKGAPRIRLDAVKAAANTGAGSVTGQVIQDKPFFAADIELSLETRNGPTARTIHISEGSSPFEFTGVSAPKQLVIDPGYHTLRRLDPTEIPPTVNALKSSSAAALVVCSQAGTNGRRLADVLLRSLGIRHYTIMAEDDLGPGRLDDRDVILVGLPRDQGLLRTAPNGLILNERGFALHGSTPPADVDTFFGVISHPGDPLRVLAVFLPGPPAAAEIAAAKITHYGRYSYLAFKDGQIKDKGSWAVTRSPVVHRWD